MNIRQQFSFLPKYMNTSASFCHIHPWPPLDDWIITESCMFRFEQNIPAGSSKDKNWCPSWNRVVQMVSFIAVSKYQMPNCSFDKARQCKGLNIASWWNGSEWWILLTNISKCSLFKHCLQQWLWKFYTKGIMHRGRSMNTALKIHVYTNKSPNFGGRNNTLADSEVNIFTNTC